MEKKKIFIFGIDGADFEAISEYIDSLPNLQSFLWESACAPLISTTPPHTSLGWVSLSTGVTPGRHGIFQFWKTKLVDYQPDFFKSDDVASPFVWDWLSKKGIRVNIVNVPMTHPPHPVNGCIISWPLTNTLRFSYPTYLLAEVSREVGPYLSDLATMYRGEPDYIDKAERYIRRRTNTILHLIQKYPADFYMVVFTEVDRVSHFDYAGFGTDLKKAYMLIDQAIGEIRAALPEDTVFAIVSDHGFTSGKWDFYIHEWLCEQRLLTYTDENDPNQWYLNSVDWTQTLCYMPAPGSYGLNINLVGREKLGNVKSKDFSDVCMQIKEKLMQLVTPDGLPFLQDVAFGTDVYRGPQAQHASDLVLIPHDYGNMIQPSRSPQTGKWFMKANQAGQHRKEGIFMLSAQGVNAGMHPPLTIEDAIPNILHAAGEQIPDHLDGHISESLFQKIWFLEHPPRMFSFNEIELVPTTFDNKGYTDEEKQVIERRLRDLGYL